MKFCIDNDLLINLGSISQIIRFGKKYTNRNVSLRINPDCGVGHHHGVITGCEHSKFGIYFDQIDEALKACNEYKLRVIGFHAHIGSGILDLEKYKELMDILLPLAMKIKGLEFVDFGGGLGIPYTENEKQLPIKEFGKMVSEKFSKFCKDYGNDLMLYIEPGRYLVAESGALLITVNNIKRTRAHKFIGTDSGFNHLIRPMAYGSYHPVENISNINGKKEKVVVAGNLCESGDLFTRDSDGPQDREIAEIREGDILAIKIAGAYGYAMSSNYNMRERTAEVLIKENGEIKLIRRRETYDDMLRTQLEV